MLTDREQDQLAAHAAGIEIDHYRGDVAMIKRGNSRGGEELVAWQPKVDDGDAFRLAVDLGLDVEQWSSGAVEQWPDEDGRGPYAAVDVGWLVIEHHGSDAYSATRLAIWRAAVRVGERLA